MKSINDVDRAISEQIRLIEQLEQEVIESEKRDLLNWLPEFDPLARLEDTLRGTTSIKKELEAARRNLNLLREQKVRLMETKSIESFNFIPIASLIIISLIIVKKIL